MTKNCIKSWRPIGYQNMDGLEFPATCESTVELGGCDIKVGKNFLRLGTANDFEKFISTDSTLGSD